MTSSRPLTRAFARYAPIVAVCTLFAAPARAQRTATDLESARQLYNQGVELRDRGDLKGALEKLRAAHALGNTPITGAELCKTHAALAQPVEAREVCLGVGRIPPLGGETARSQDARNEAARIAEDVKTRIAIVRLTVTGVPQGREATVTVDGAPVPAAALGQARALNPGKHELVARLGAGPETRSSLELAAGESKDITLPVQALPEEATPLPVGPGASPASPPPKERSNGLATAGFIVGGLGVGIGAVTGLVALSGKSDLDETCTGDICGRADHEALDSARTWGNVATAGFIVGGVGLLVGLVATLTSPKANAALAPAPRAVAQAGRSVSVTPDLGPGGVGIHGSF